MDVRPDSIDDLRAIDDIDADIIALIHRRRELAAEIRKARLAANQPLSNHSHETNIYQQYVGVLGRSGLNIAGAILSTCRRGSPS